VEETMIEKAAQVDGLEALVEILASWIDPVPGIPALYLFGSRVRGDHRPDSDVDVRLYWEEWSFADPFTAQWSTRQNDADFAELRVRLPGPLDLGRDPMNFHPTNFLGNVVDPAIAEARRNPFLLHRKVVCLLTPPKPRPVDVTVR
jgi:polymorphic toxin system nucleotidyltransferase-like protein